METSGENEIRNNGSVGTRKPAPEPVYSDAYLDDQMRKAKPAWESVPDPEAWLEELSGGAGYSRDIIKNSSHGH